MNSYIHDTIIDIERRTQEILDDLRALREQVFYTYDPSENDDHQEEQEADCQDTLEYMVANDK